MLNCDELMDDFLLKKGILKAAPSSSSRSKPTDVAMRDSTQKMLPASTADLKGIDFMYQPKPYASVAADASPPAKKTKPKGELFLAGSDADSGPPIPIVNECDDEQIPKSFVYVAESVYSTGATVPDKDFLVGCDCFDCATSEYCVCRENNAGAFPYSATDGKLRVLDGRQAIFECNERCFCGPACPNRLVQKGRRARLLLKRFPDGRGWGVIADESLPRGTFVAQYVGEIISSKEATRRFRKYSSAQQMYLFDLDYNYDKGCECDFTIDAYKFGNISHFFNHSCEPNLAVRPCLINNLDPRMHLVAFFTSKDVLPGEELCFDYLGLRDGNLGNISADSAGTATAHTSFLKKPKLKCLCGAKTCRKYVYL